MPPVRSGRIAGRNGFKDQRRPAREQRQRRQVGDLAEHVGEGILGAGADLAALPAQVENEGQIDTDRDQAEPEHVEVALLELFELLATEAR